MKHRDKIWCLYTITCIINGKIYIGVSNNFLRRANNHKLRLRIGDHRNGLLQEDYNKYGAASFEYDLISVYPNQIEALRVEKYYTDYVFCMNKDLCYNIFSGGTPAFTYLYNFGKIPKSKETIEKIRAGNLGKKKSSFTLSKIRGANNKRCKPVIDTSTGKIYAYMKEVCDEFNYSPTYIRAMINGKRPNKTKLKWVS